MKKITIFSIPIFVYILLNILFSSQINKHFYSIRYKHEIYNLHSGDVFKYVVVGNSHARDSFLMDDNNLLNLGLSGQNLYWSNQMLLKYDEYINPNAKILIEVSYFSLCDGEQEGAVRYVPLGFNRSELDLSLEEYLIERYLPLVGFNRTEFLLTNDNNHFANNLYEFSSEYDLMNNSIEFSDRLVYKFLCDKDILNLNINILEDIILRQKAGGREVILFSSPLFVSEFQIDKSHENVERFHLVISELSEKMNVTYIDHTYLKGLSDNYLFFRNANHLNNLGSYEYWMRFKNDVLS